MRSVMYTSLFLFLAAMGLMSCGSNNAGTTKISTNDGDRERGYEINITVKNFTANKAYLAHHFGSTNQLADSTVASNGSFTFKGDQWLPEGMYMVILPPNNTYFEIVVDKDQHFSLTTDTTSYIDNMEVEGSRENEVMFGDIAFLGEQRKKVEFLRGEQANAKAAGNATLEKEILDKISEIDKVVMDHRAKLSEDNPDLFFPKFLRSMENPEIPEQAPEGYSGENWQFFYYRDHFFDTFDFSDSRLLRTPAMWNKVNQYMEQLTVKHPDSVIKSADYILDKARASDDMFEYLVAKLLNTYGVESKIMGMDAVYVHMVEKYYLSGDAWWADSTLLDKMKERALALSPNLVGVAAPDFYAYDYDGKQVHLYGVDAEYTIVYFWDYDCGHCQKVTPQLSKIYPKYLDKGVKVFAVSINGDEKVWKERVKEYGLDKAINVHDPRRVSGFDQMYDISSTPRIFIMDKDKIIRYKHIGVEQLEEIIQRELGMLEEDES
ncbi:MAG: DUF5106 domain-containing protein [Bacteroidetes bacterium]|nr:DUF5106 domain-containing protein [Bacteroidota bacterium]